MAYITNGFMIIENKQGDQIIIDEFDGGIDISPQNDMTSTRQSTKGRTIASMKMNVPYTLDANVPPFSDVMERVENFFQDMKSKNFPDLTITVYERIDSKYKVSPYTDGNFMSALDYDNAVSEDAPKGKISFYGTRGVVTYKTTI